MRFAGNLGVGESKGRQSSQYIGLVSLAVLGVLGGGPVIPQAVRLDNQAETRPVEVRPVLTNQSPGQRLREVGLTNQSEETALELGVGQGENAAVEQLAKLRCSNRSRFPSQSPLQLFRTNQVQSVGFVYRRFQLAWAQSTGEVDQGSSGSR